MHRSEKAEPPAYCLPPPLCPGVMSFLGSEGPALCPREGLGLAGDLEPGSGAQEPE